MSISGTPTQTIHEQFAELARRIEANHGVVVTTVSFDWSVFPVMSGGARNVLNTTSLESHKRTEQ